MDTITAIEFREPLLLLLALLAVPLFLLARRAPGRLVFSSLGILPEEAGGWRRRVCPNRRSRSWTAALTLRWRPRISDFPWC